MKDKDLLEYVTTIYIDAKDRAVDQPLNNFVLSYISKVQDIDYIAVYKYQFTNNIYPVTSANNGLHFIYDGNAYDITIAEGNYTGLTLASALQTAMLTAIAPAVDLTVTWSSLTYKLVFNSTTKTMNFFTNPATYTNTIARIAGFIIDSKDTANFQYPQVADMNVVPSYPVSITKTRYIDVCSNFLTQYNRASAGSNAKIGKVLKRIHNNAYNFGAEEVTSVRNLNLIKWKKEYPIDGNVDIQVYDEDGNLASLGNSLFNIEIACYKIKDQVLKY